MRGVGLSELAAEIRHLLAVAARLLPLGMQRLMRDHSRGRLTVRLCRIGFGRLRRAFAGLRGRLSPSSARPAFGLDAVAFCPDTASPPPDRMLSSGSLFKVLFLVVWRITNARCPAAAPAFAWQDHETPVTSGRRRLVGTSLARRP